MRKLVRTSLTVAVTGAATVSMVAPAMAATTLGPGTETQGDIARIAGQDRIGTALAAAQSGLTSQAFDGSSVVLARADQYADALTATPLANCANAPVLLTPAGSLDPRVATFLKDKGITKVTIAGSSGAVSYAVEDALRARGVQVTRVGGADRYATAAALAKEAVACMEKSTALPTAERALGDALAAQRAVPVAQQRMVAAKAALDAATAKVADLTAKQDSLQAQITGLAKQLVPTTPPAGYPSWNAYVAQASAALDAAQAGYQKDVAQAAVFTGLLGTDAASTLNTDSTLQEYVDQFPAKAAAIQAAASWFGLSLSTPLNNAIAAANARTATDSTAVTTTGNELAKRVSEQMAAAKAQAANDGILAQMGALYPQFDATNKALAAAKTAAAAAQNTYVQAVSAYTNALTAEPTSADIAALQANVTKARAALNAVAGRYPAFTATGLDFPDALSAGAASQGPTMKGVVLLTAGRVYEANTAGYLAASKPQVVAIGGSAAAAAKGDKTATYYVGSDRYATAASVAKALFPVDAPVAVASGENFPDAVVASAYIANHEGALLLTGAQHLAKPTNDYLMWHSGTSRGIRIFGASGVVSNTVRAEIGTALLK